MSSELVELIQENLQCLKVQLHPLIVLDDAKRHSITIDLSIDDFCTEIFAMDKAPKGCSAWCSNISTWI